MGPVVWLENLRKAPLVSTVHKAYNLTDVEFSGIVFEVVGWIQVAQEMVHWLTWH
jgi:hypothetical protein